MLRKDGVPILCEAACDGNVDIIRFLLDSVQTAQHTDTVSEMLLAQGDDGQTLWHLAKLGGGGGKVQVIEKLLECANEKLETDEINNKLLLSKDRREQTIWIVAADESNTDNFLYFADRATQYIFLNIKQIDAINLVHQVG